MEMETTVVLDEFRKISDQIDELTARLDGIETYLKQIGTWIRHSPGRGDGKLPVHEPYHYPDEEWFDMVEAEELAAAKMGLSAAQSRLADAISGMAEYNCTYADPSAGEKAGEEG